MWREFGIALALVLILEGITPFLNPAGLRRILQAVQLVPDGTLRLIGFISMMLGLALLYAFSS